MSADTGSDYDPTRATLRDGETVDHTTHARRNDLGKATLKADKHRELPANERTVIELLAFVGEAASTPMGDVLAETTEFEFTTAKAALSRLRSKGLVESRYEFQNPRAPIYSLTDAGRMWIRNFGGDA